MTKQEQRIKDAWIGTGKQVTWNSEGWARFGSKQDDFSDDFEEKQWLGYYFYRPKSLSERSEIDLKLEGAEEVLGILVERGTIKFSEAEKLLEPYYIEMEKLSKEI